MIKYGITEVCPMTVRRFLAALILAAILCAGLMPAASADMPCVWCNGRGEVTCSNCNGSGSAYGSVRGSCYKCHGSGYETCIHCRGTGRVGADLSGTPEPGDSGTPEQPKMALSRTYCTLTAGHMITLELKNAAGTVTWSSDHPGIASVDSLGNVLGKKAGSATITATCGGKSFTCAVTVTAKVWAKKIAFAKQTVTVPNHKTQKLDVTLTPQGITEPYTLTWTSSKPKVAAVSQEGAVTAKKAGSTTVTVTLTVKDKEVASASCTVKVRSVSAKKIAFDKKAFSVPNHKTLKLPYTLSPAADTLTEPYTLSFTSSDRKVATVSKKGVVTAKKAGTVTITAALTVGGKQVDTASCTVRVKSVSAKKIAFRDKVYTLRVGKTLTPGFTITPAVSTLTEPYTLAWTSSNPKTVSVSSGGTLTGLKAGSSKITVTLSVNGKEVKKASCTVKVQSSGTQLANKLQQIGTNENGSYVYTEGGLTVTLAGSSITFTRDEGYTRISLTMPKSGGSGTLNYYYASPYGTGLNVKASAPVALSALVHDGRYAWTYTAGDSGYADMADTSVNTLMNLIGSFLSSRMGWSLADIGITGY